MLYLYEIELPGWPGESYRRVYVIASQEEQALQLAFDAFQRDGQQPPESITLEDLVIDEQILIEDGFCSKPSSYGLEV